jgi:uncharacterized protein (TIGR00297 family)
MDGGMAFAPLLTILLTVALCFLLSALAYVKGVLTWDGSLAAFVVGFVIGVFGDIMWLFLLLFFLVSSFAATRYRFALKQAMGVQEGAKGERRSTNVLANGLAPMAIALLSLLSLDLFPKPLAGLAFLSALAVAGADTLASEIGVLSRRTYLIVNLKRVDAGTDGGVSLLGQISALAAALYTAVIGWLILVPVSEALGMAPTFPLQATAVLIPVVVGFGGCQLDSVIGATLERRGWVNKKTNNLISTTVGAVAAVLLFALY